MSYQVTFTNELYHHGVKGQRWGIRRFRKKDGSLTSTGKRRYNFGKKKSTHRLNLEQKYIKSGLSRENAEQEADKKIKIEKGIAIVAGAAALTVASIIAYKKIGQEYSDKVIKKGKTIHTLSPDADRLSSFGKYNPNFYASTNKHDNNIYRSLYGKSGGKNKFDIQSVAKTDVKIASPNKAKKTFIDLFKKDSNYAKYIGDNMHLVSDEKDTEQVKKLLKDYNSGKKLTDKEIGKIYGTFNRLLVDEGGGTPHTNFIRELGKKGYSGTIDLNDIKYSGYKAKSPVVIFDKSNFNIKPTEQVKRLTNKEITNATRIYNGRQTVKKILKNPNAYTTSISATFIAGGAANSIYDSKVSKKYKNKGGKG